MIEIPSPLHPAFVHFPIALSFVTVLFVLCTVFNKRALGYTFGMFLLTFLSVIATQYAGSYSASQLGDISPTLSKLISEHSDYSDWIFGFTLAGTMTSLIAWITNLKTVKSARNWFITLTLFIACANLWAVYETGRRGGNLVFKHGAGVTTDQTPSRSTY